MAKLDYTRQPTTSKLNSEYYSNPSKGFDKHWHHNNKLKQEAKARKELEQARQKIKALRQRG
jgi:hypothetical protein